jgi:hypothetical protein
MAIRISYEQTFTTDAGVKMTREEYIAALDALGVSHVNERIPMDTARGNRTYYATLTYELETDPRV